ncbi:MAG: RNA-binding domain-containing protein, partial [Candidatus Bathyarchaeia archaeon]
MEIQELVTRGRLLFSGAPKRFEVFKSINGKRSAKEIAHKVGKDHANTLKDLQKMNDFELISTKKDANDKIIKKDGSIVYEKASLVRHISDSYFEESTKIVKEIVESRRSFRGTKARDISRLHIPNEKEILTICKDGEDQLYEFKTAGTDVRKLTKEIAAFANTKLGGLIFYGIDDDGVIVG